MIKDRYYKSLKDEFEREERKEMIADILYGVLTFVIGIVFAYLFMIVMPD